MADWRPDLSNSDKPRYLAIADAIADDIGAGRLVIGDRLPPQRKLAKRPRSISPRSRAVTSKRKSAD